MDYLELIFVFRRSTKVMFYKQGLAITFHVIPLGRAGSITTQTIALHLMMMMMMKLQIWEVDHVIPVLVFVYIVTMLWMSGQDLWWSHYITPWARRLQTSQHGDTRWVARDFLINDKLNNKLVLVIFISYDGQHREYRDID